MEEEALEGEWMRLVAPYEVAPMLTETTWQELHGAYTAPQRHYHTLAHVAALLTYAKEFRSALPDYDAVRFAIWFHDAVYNPLRNDNELRSAQQAIHFLQQTRFESVRLQQVAHWIRRTQRHQDREPNEPVELHWFLAFDLAVLSASPAVYQRYAQQIRQEYRHVPDLLYKPGRRKVLEAFLNEPTLYRTAHFQQREAQARENLRAELEKLH
ncbi:Predicted metal-dependent phosphohydrolase, HD superfamily [Catalinimonas alkaloidigena]|uniref:Predicted metal-dependent phosphohydrolase, HD superfamily n=1 Tax=Catalinimonas alkaloidigena TaxID=1075417 RepID=A0A1G9BC65_9BACT|nr:hypothetical protein [Catalinimonas alkaloidigena]SDK37071.1 Predicted metal-dependent phosphohydrolase, HD superfamily [Catalinimonas alkaloidigena]